MKCSICGTMIPPGADRCHTCGCRCHDSYTQPRSADMRYNCYESFEHTRRPKKKNSGCFCALAILIPGLIVLLLSIYFMISLFTGEFTLMTPESAVPEPSTRTESLPEPVSDEYFTIRDGAVHFIAERWDGGTVVTVPETVDGQTVTALGDDCFRDCEELTTIVLPDTVTRIGTQAFAGCRNLRGMFIPETVVSIEKEAFSGCISMEAIYVPSSVDEIAPGCFDDCASLLFIFYEGAFEQWNALYSDYITPHTTAICLDGNYYHGVQD